MRILKEFKIPNFKFPKFRLGEIGELKINFDEMKKNQEDKERKRVKNYETTSYTTIQEVFKEVTRKYGENVCILEKYETKGVFKEITYSQFEKDVSALGTALSGLLDLKNERVAIIGETTYQWYVSYMAMLCGSGIVVPIDKELPANEIENVLRRAGVQAVIYSTKKKDVIKKVEDNLPGVNFFIEMNSDKEIEDRKVGLNHLINMGNKMIEKGDDYFEKVIVQPDDFKVLLFTSGTTSNAKGVMLSSRNLAENINAVRAYVIVTEKDRLFSVLPLHHTYESTIGFLVPFSVGASIGICQGLKYIVQNLKEIKPTIMLGVPLLIENLYKKINANIVKTKKDTMVNSMIHVTNALKTVNVDIKRKIFNEIYESLGGNLRLIVSAAAPIDAKVGKWIEDIGILFIQGYGLTETAPICALTPDFETKVGSAGRAVNCSELKIDSPNDKGEGEILIKSKTLMLGYYQDEKATNEAIELIDGERWFHSGDVGYLDKNGFLYITGRCKNVIVTQNGKNIYPEEIELLLGDIPEIKECMVYGKENENKKDDRELILTVRVIPNYDEIAVIHGKNKTDDEIYDIIWNQIKAVNRTLTSYKAIKKLEIKKGEFEKTTTMKIKRFAEIKK
ncbi:MAG: AMP-binding protein [Clostridia bacterium]|nr:AMP-binding protein [Clostridia bacterium]